MWAVVLAIVLASPPQELGARLAQEVTDAARENGARRVRIDVKAAPDLAGAPALVEIAEALESRLGSRLAGPGESADLEVVAELTRVRGRVAIGGAVKPKGWVLVSTEETPEWWAWLAPIAGGTIDRGFAWSQAGRVRGEVRDADAGDLDGDGRVEFAAATDEELIVFAASATGVAEIARAPLGNGEAADVATRAPRAFVRIVNGGEIHVRKSDEKRTRVFAFENSNANARLARRADRDVLVVATRPGGREPVIGELAPGTNHFAQAPKLKRGTSGKALASGGPWIDARAADLLPLEQLSTTGATWGLLDANGTLRLLRADLSEASRVPKCGAAYALADLDGDAKSEALCSSDGSQDSPDRLSLGKLWSTETAGPVTAIAAGPAVDGPAALVFVRDADSTTVWLLRKLR